MAVSIQQLIQNQPPLVTVEMDDSLQNALTLMIENDFSQLPVLENGKPYGKEGALVTSDSILRALRLFHASLDDLRVRDAIVQVRTIGADDDLFSQIDDLFHTYAVLVTDSEGALVGIVTNYDTAHYFRRRALDMLLAENIETTLKGYLREAYGGNEDDANGALQCAVNNLTTHQAQNREKCRSALSNLYSRMQIAKDNQVIQAVLDAQFPEVTEKVSFHKLTLDQYITLARTDDAWKVLEPVFGLPKEHFAKMMNSMRETRNKLMHFNPNISTTERELLKTCSKWFDNHPFERMTDNAIAESHDGETGNSSPPQLQDGNAENGGGTATLSQDESVEESNSAEEPTPEEVELIEDEETPDKPVAESVESKYAPLANYFLKQLKRSERVILPFETIEDIIQARLPDAARENRSWWDNNPQSRVQSSQWLKVNWSVVSVNMTTQKVTFARAHERAKTYITFFSAVQELLRKRPQFPLVDANPSGINWLPLHKFECQYPVKPSIVLSFAQRHRLRLELYLDCGDAEINRRLFLSLQHKAKPLEGDIGQALSWEPLEKRRACRVAIYTSGGIDDPDGVRNKLASWAVDYAIRFYSALSSPLHEALDGLEASSSYGLDNPRLSK